MAIHTAETDAIEAQIAARNFDEMIEEAAIATWALARKFFGDAAYLVQHREIDRETGREDVVFEVHYCFPDPENDLERLVALHQSFTDAFVRATSSDILYRIILRPVLTDAD